MFFDKEDIEKVNGYTNEFIDADKVLQRINDAIKDKLAITPDYSNGEKIRVKDAEDLLMGFYQLLNKVEG